MRTLVFISTLTLAGAFGMGTLWATCMAVQWLGENMPLVVLQWLDLNLRIGMFVLLFLACGGLGVVASRKD